MNYMPDQKRRVEYLLRRLGELRNGHTLSPQYTQGYPFRSYMDRFGRTTISAEETKVDFIYQYLNKHPNSAKKVDLIEVAWEYFLVYGTPNGNLFKDNSCFETIKQGRGLTLIHCTTSLNEIEESGLLYPSGGCLGASLYSVPLRSDGRVHNLTKFLIEEEMPFFLRSKDGQKRIETIAIHLESENFIHSNEESNGMNYLLMGDLLFEVYILFREWFGSKFNSEPLFSLEAKIADQVCSVTEFLNTCVDFKMDEMTDGEFLIEFHKALEKLPLLGYLYFETLSEYVTLFQDDGVSQEHKELGELYNANFKRMVFELCPLLSMGFKLTQFRPEVPLIINYLKREVSKGNIFSYFNEDRFLHFLKWRFAQYVRSKLLNREYVKSNCSYDQLTEGHASLVGQLVYREIKDHPELSKSYYMYDEIKAKIIWREWVNQYVVYPFNSIIPKGEVGINPGYPYLDYKIHKVAIDANTGEVKFGKKILATLAYEMIKSDMHMMKPRIG